MEKGPIVKNLSLESPHWCQKVQEAELSINCLKEQKKPEKFNTGIKQFNVLLCTRKNVAVSTFKTRKYFK